jgi:hypothetical protein
VPLYMVREFEQKSGVSSLSTPGVLDANRFTNFYPMRVKASIRDAFSYLFHKGDVYPCTSCKKDVPYRCFLLTSLSRSYSVLPSFIY